MNKLRTVHGTVHEHQIKPIIGTAQEQTHKNLFGTIALELMKNKGVLEQFWSVPKTLKFLSHLIFHKQFW